MSKAKRKHRPKPPQRQSLEEQASPELRSLIKTYEVLPRGNWEDALAIKNAHGHESEIAKHVEKTWAACDSGRKQAFRSAISFPARGYADLAVKLAFARADRWLAAVPEAAAVLTQLHEDVTRLAKAVPPVGADKELLGRVSDCEAAMAVHRTISEQRDAERSAAEQAADAAGFNETKGYSDNPWQADQARRDFIDGITPPRSFERWNDAHKEIGRTAKAVFAMKPKTIRGAIAKLRLVVKLIEADDLDTWEGDHDWLAETLADFERVTGVAS